MHRISLAPTKEKELQQIAKTRGLSSDELIESYILCGISRSRLAQFRAIVRYIGACLITAAFVLIGLRLFSLSINGLYSPSQIPGGRVLHWTREIIFSFTPWPITILLGLWLIARSGSAFWLLLGVFGFLRRIKLFGAELELNEQSKRKIQAAATEIDLAVHEYKKRVDREVDRLASLHQIDHNFATFLDSDLLKRLVPTRELLRCTIHIPDPIEHGRLYQLLDYYPTGSGHGRTFSTRYGIIGKVWRTDESLLEPDLFSSRAGTTLPPQDHESIIRMIMRDWGMNRREAEHAINHRSYFCFLLTHERTKVGLVYMDSKQEKVFYETYRADVIEQANKELAPMVSKLLDELSAVSLEIDSEKN